MGCITTEAGERSSFLQCWSCLLQPSKQLCAASVLSWLDCVLQRGASNSPIKAAKLAGWDKKHIKALCSFSAVTAYQPCVWTTLWK